MSRSLSFKTCTSDMWWQAKQCSQLKLTLSILLDEQYTQRRALTMNPSTMCRYQFHDICRCKRYECGIVCLCFLYDHLSDANMHGCHQFVGYIYDLPHVQHFIHYFVKKYQVLSFTTNIYVHVFQAWIYEHFLIVDREIVTTNFQTKPRACR